jgi:glucan phosphoethanolaminetransferase (alkaline phosphatase superfamily)
MSFGYMYFFAGFFGISRRVALIHVSVVAGLILLLLIITGLPLLSRRVRGWRVTRYAIALIFAVCFSTLVILYLANFAGNRLWGNNVNYQLASQYLLRRDIFRNDMLFLSARLYLLLASGALLIVVIHLALSRQILWGLEQLFLPGQPHSLLRDRRRALKSGTALVLALVVYGAYVHALAQGRAASWQSGYEPILSFLRADVFDLNRTALAARLRTEEPRVRARYRHDQFFAKKNVVLMIVDSLRADHMQIYGYHRPTTPFLNELLQTGKLKQVKFATSTCAESNCGILSTLSSKTLRGIIPEDFKLNDVLHDLGYNTYFVLSGNHTSFGLRKSYGSEMTYYFDGSNTTRYSNFSDDRLLFDGLEKVPNFDGTPSFFYFHLMSAHFFGIKQERYEIYRPFQISRGWTMLMQGEIDPVALVNNYDNGITQADATIELLFDWLKRKGYLDQSIVVILSDHGEGLGERGQNDFGHNTSLYQEFLRIPLLIYDDASYANLDFATQIDVAPTILGRLGLSIPDNWQGESLLSANHRQYSFHQTSLRNPTYAVMFRTQGAIYEYLYKTGDRSEELYELTSDPLERHNLINSADAALIKRLRDKFAEYLSQS